MLFRVYPLLCKRVNSVVANPLPIDPCVSEPLYSNGRLFYCRKCKLGNMFTEPLPNSHMRQNIENFIGHQVLIRQLMGFGRTLNLSHGTFLGVHELYGVFHSVTFNCRSP
jgi:hypothetical protein